MKSTRLLVTMVADLCAITQAIAIHKLKERAGQSKAQNQQVDRSVKSCLCFPPTDPCMKTHGSSSLAEKFLIYSGKHSYFWQKSSEQ